MTAWDVEALKAVIAGVAATAALLALFLNAYATLRNVESRRLLNYHEIIKSHRDIWTMFLDKPEQYGRVTAETVDLTRVPITDEERSFVHLVFLHMTSAYYFSLRNDIIKIEKLKMDFDEFVALPIPAAVWAEHSRYFNRDFVRFVDRRHTLWRRVGLRLGLVRPSMPHAGRLSSPNARGAEHFPSAEPPS